MSTYCEINSSRSSFCLLTPLLLLLYHCVLTESAVLTGNSREPVDSCFHSRWSGVANALAVSCLSQRHGNTLYYSPFVLASLDFSSEIPKD